MTDTILNLFRRRVNSTPVEERVFDRACAEVVRMHRTFEVRQSEPSHVSRAWCQDCEGVVILLDSGACPCGSRSVMPHGARRAA